MVAAITRRRGSRLVEPKAYRALHQELLAICQGLAAGAEEGEGGYYQRLQEVVQPWLTPSVLARTDQEILVQLLARCRAVEKELGGPPWSWALRRWLQRSLLGLTILAFLGAAGWVARVNGASIPEALRQGRLWLGQAVANLDATDQLILVVIVVSLIAMAVIIRGSRR
jgi:hypothetical protein